MMGDVFFRYDQQRKAQNEYKSLVFAMMGNAFFRYDQDKAIDCYETAIELNQNNPYAHYKRGFAYEIQGNYKKALNDYQEAFRIAPDNLEYLHNVAYSLYENGCYDSEDIRERPKCFKEKPTEDQHRGAIGHYRRLVKLRPNLLPAYLEGAQVCRVMGNLHKDCLTRAYKPIYTENCSTDECSDQARIEELLEDDDVMEAWPWVIYYYPAKAGPDEPGVWLTNAPEARHYAYYSLAFTYYLQQEDGALAAKEKARKWVKKAKNQPDSDVSEDVHSGIIKLMKHHVHMVQEEQEDMSATAQRFEETFLKN